MNRLARTLLFLSLLLLGHAVPAAASPGFLVLAPDRGFLGNEEARDAFEAFRAQVPASVLAFATAERTEENLRRALDELMQRGEPVGEVVVLPLFLSEHEVLYRKAEAVLRTIEQPAVRIARVLGRSYLAEEILFDRVRALLPDGFEPPAGGHGDHGDAAHGGHAAGGHAGHGTAHAGHDATHAAASAGGPRLVLVGSGAGSAADEAAIRADLAPMARRAAEKFGLAGAEVVVLYDGTAPGDAVASAYDRAVAAVVAAAAEGPVLVVPFNFGRRMTTMMADWTRLHGRLASIANAEHDGQGVIPHPNVERWLLHTANGYLPLAQEDIGVILVPHGSDHNWNEAMRAAMAPIREKYVTEEAFSMVDPYVVERAVRRLEAKGVKAAVLVRIFSLESSFKEQAEYILGLRPDYRGPHAERISSHLRFATTGGLEAHPLLAEAMLERAREISEDPSRETVVLVAHGTGGDAEDAHWMRNLESIARYIQSESGGAFRDVKFHTWREDWPEKRAASIQAIRAMVEEAGRDGGTALVIPVRTIDRGPEAAFLEGLTYRHGTGFAPHPGFVQWLEEMIAGGIAALTEPVPGDDTAHHH